MSVVFRFRASISSLDFELRFRVQISSFDFEIRLLVSISRFDFELRFRALISSFDFQFRFRASISSFDFQFRFRASISSFDLELRFGASIWSFDFQFRFRASISSFDFQFRFRASISSFDFELRLGALISSFDFLTLVLMYFNSQDFNSQATSEDHSTFMGKKHYYNSVFTKIGQTDHMVEIHQEFFELLCNVTNALCATVCAKINFFLNFCFRIVAKYDLDVLKLYKKSDCTNFSADDFGILIISVKLFLAQKWAFLGNPTIIALNRHNELKILKNIIIY